MVFSKLGTMQGFEHGWFDGLRNKPAKYRPDIGFSVIGPEYLDAYQKSYEDGYETAERELSRAERLLKNTQFEHSHDLERE